MPCVLCTCAWRAQPDADLLAGEVMLEIAALAVTAIVALAPAYEVDDVADAFATFLRSAGPDA
jgi:hypothetical protein